MLTLGGQRMSNQVVSNQPVSPRTAWALPDSEWNLLVTLPGRVVIGATSAQPDRARRTVVEGLAGLDAIAAGRSSASRLVRDVVSAVYQEPDDRPAAQEFTDRAAGIADVLAACRDADRLLRERVDRVEADAYRHWLLAIATRVCHAARTGGLLGIGGAALRPAERAFLADLTAALHG
jgi:hypothetical protein